MTKAGLLCSRYSRVSPIALFSMVTAAGVSVAALVAYGLTLRWAVLTFYTFLFVAAAAIDVERGIIPNRLIYLSLPAVLLAATFLPAGMETDKAPLSGLLQSVSGAASAALVFSIPAWLNPQGMGWGDVKLAGVAGLATGFPGALVAAWVSITGAGAVAAVLLLSGLRRRQDTIPFAPFLAAGTLTALAWGHTITGWVGSLAG